MILPTPRRDGTRQHATSIGGAVLLMIVLYSGLRGTPLPDLSSSRHVIRQLDPLFVERYAAPAAVEPAPDEGEEATEAAAPSLGSLEQEVGLAIDELARRFSGSSAGDEVAGESSDIDPAVRPGIGATIDESRFAEVFGGVDEEVTVAAPAGRAPVDRPATRGRGIDLVAGIPSSNDSVGDRVTLDPIDIAVEAPTTREGVTDPTDVVIKDFQPENLDRTEVEVLGDWMDANPSQLPVGVRVHLNYVESFLTASVPVTTDRGELELYLMFNRSLRELHIVLVEGDRSVYLIDRGFQAQSRSLREGVVQRVDGEIVTINSSAGSASSARAREFYNIFLSWWEVVQRDVSR